MFSKSKQKYILSLQRKKIRQNEGVFIAEGRKTIETLIQTNSEIIEVFTTDENAEFLNQFDGAVTLISRTELKSISSYTNPDEGLAIVKIPQYSFDFDCDNPIVLFLDRINDPGNIGTIIRLADWFGIKQILINKGTTDPFQNKSVQSTMGAIGNVKIIEVENEILNELSTSRKIIATKMDGESLYNTPNNTSPCVLIMGNEANGIGPEVMEKATHYVSIPKHENSTSESLNVAMSCGIFLSHFSKP